MSNKTGLALLVVALSTSACSGGGGGGGNNIEPCCSAEGETVPPGSGFGAAPARYAQAVKVNQAPLAADCADLDGALDFAPVILADASDVVRVEDDGTFSLEIYDEVLDAPAVGERFFVVVFDGEPDARVYRGMGSLAENAVTDATIGVAPILFGAGGVIGETTLEAGVACLMAAANAIDPAGPDSLQGMTGNDVRAFIDDELTSAFNGTGVGGAPRVLGVRDLAKDYRHGINGMRAVLTTSGLMGAELQDNLDLLARYREDAETMADECRLGLLSGTDGCSGTVDPLRADSYRYWFLARNVGSTAYPIVWNNESAFARDTMEVLTAWAEDVYLRLQAGGGLTTAYELAAYRQNQLLRLELAHANLRFAYSCYGDTDGVDTNGDGLCEGPLALDTAQAGWTGLEGPGGSVETMRQVILNGTASDIIAAWDVFADNVVYNFGQQADPVAYTDSASAPYTTNVIGQGKANATATRFDMLDGCNADTASDWSNTDIRSRIFFGANRCNGTVNGPYLVISNAVDVEFSNDLERGLVTEVVFWATFNRQ